MRTIETKKLQASNNSQSQSGADVDSLLLVDDDSVLAGLWQIYLQNIGYQVDCCGTVGDAEVLLQSNHYRVLIVDLFLREDGRILEEGGVTLINRVRLNGRFDNTDADRMAVLAVTGAPARSGGKFSAANSIQNLADSVLHKPVRLEELAEEIRRLIAATV